MSSTAATRSRDWKGDFLEGLRVFGNVGEACENAGIARRTAYKARDEDVEFAEQWKEALEDHTDARRSVVAKELHRRAVEGIEKAIFYKGKHVDSVIEYSDALLALQVKMLFGDQLRDHVDVQHSGNVGNTDRDTARRLLLDPAAAKLANEFERRMAELAGGNGEPTDPT